MIDTIKIFTQINEQVYKIIHYNSNVMKKFNESTGELFYKITTDDLKGTYDSNIHIGVGLGSKYGFVNSYYLEIECSIHKILQGHNAFNGYYNVPAAAQKMIKIVEDNYNIKLPKLKHWFLGRIDITKSFDLGTQENVEHYINSLKMINYPRRNKGTYNTSLNFPGASTTLKIYNKLAEFEKHDRTKMSKFVDFDLLSFENKIRGFVRFECEIKSRKLKAIYKKKYIRLIKVEYLFLEKIWSDEFMKLLKIDDLRDKKILNRVKTKEEVKQRLGEYYDERKSFRLYNFFLLVLNDGFEMVRDMMNKSSFYRNIKDLKQIGIDFSTQEFEDIPVVDFNKVINFDPFLWKEVV